MVEKPTGCDCCRRLKSLDLYIWYQSLWLSDNHGSVGYYSLEIESVVLQNEFECNNSYESVFVSEYEIVLYCDDWFIEWHMNLRQHGLDNYAEWVYKHLNRTIRHSIVLNWVNEIILP